jgi:S-sulfo-L-cysteine synthase (O-acetyl-L-serine-dependent)
MQVLANRNVAGACSDGTGHRKNFGSELSSPAAGGSNEAVRVAKSLAAENPDWVMLYQYGNPANALAHFEGTGPEILADLPGITHFVAGLGTTGTFTGVARRLKAHSPDIRCIAVQPDSPLHGLEGLKHLETALVPGIYDDAVADSHVFVSTEEAYATMRRLAREEGLLVGKSTGAAVAASIKLAETLDEGTVVTVLCDTGERYLTSPAWTE